MHPKGPKHNYAYHTEAMDRAMQGGVDDVGIGVLFGLYDYKYDAVAMMLHAKHLEDTYGVGPHTISLPRIKPASDVDLSKYKPVSDDVFFRLTAIIRLAVPYTGMIISTRESKEHRAELLKLGISQLSGGSCTGVGGYCEKTEGEEVKSTEQFQVDDERTLEQIINNLCKDGYMPSFCTACYREGRTGDRFMKLAKNGQICNVCQPNAIMTLQEYVEDYANSDTKKWAEKLIAHEKDSIKNDMIKVKTEEYLGKIKSGERDFRF